MPEKIYIDRLAEDLKQQLTGIQNRTIGSIYLGGGTPSLFSAKAIGKLLDTIHSIAKVKTNAEITMEINPGTVSKQKLVALKQIGLNRLSIGVQSFSDEKLTALARIHSKLEAMKCIKNAQQAGFDNLNLDLMFGLPEQKITEAIADLQTAIKLSPQHISWYQLTIEPNTYFHRHPPITADDDQLWKMQRQGTMFLADNNYAQYEISAYAQPKYKCKHNLNYWLFGDYIGIGAGAHGKLTNLTTGKITRTKQQTKPQAYMQNTSIITISNSNITLKENEVILEFMLNILRLNQPTPTSLFTTKTGLPITKIEQQLKQAKTLGFLANNDKLIQTTPKGRQFLNDLLLIYA